MMFPRIRASLQARWGMVVIIFQSLKPPRGVRFWPDWFDIPPYQQMHDLDGRRVYPRAPGIHTVRIRTALRKFDRMGKGRDFGPANHGYTSPVFEIMITADGDDV